MQTAEELIVKNVEIVRRPQQRYVTPSTICDALTNETQGYHLRMEQRLDLFQRVLSLHDYRDVLSKFYGIYAPLEPVLWRALDPLKQELRLAERKKTPLLSSDLTACGLSNAQIVALPRLQEIAPFPSIPQALGRLYVLERATLGGQIIARHFRKLLPLKKHAGLSFFYSYGADMAERWRHFREVLSQQVVTSAQKELAVDAAIEMFDTFDRHMNGA